MRAIIVAVDYVDLLALTLPYNRHHFSEVWIVTSPADAANVKPPAIANDARVLATDLFTQGGAAFNKWSALEWGLDRMGRTGWICQLDADVLWPKEMKWEDRGALGLLFKSIQDHLGNWNDFNLVQEVGHLCAPLRRMWDGFPSAYPMEWGRLEEIKGIAIPAERSWSNFPVHRNVREWAGYSQIYHASDPTLGQPPWHETDWKHAGGADSMFQRKWPPDKKIRPPFEVLHLGPAGVNWLGRASLYADGRKPADAEERTEAMMRLWTARRGKRTEEERYRSEKLGGER